MSGGQYGEDALLGLFFRGVSTGLVVDVGAADGETGSNSWMLLKRPERNLTKVLTEFGVREEIDFLSINAEGMDWEVWQTLDKVIYNPKLVCMEGHGYQMKGYYEFCCVGGNTFYLRGDIHKELSQ